MTKKRNRPNSTEPDYPSWCTESEAGPDDPSRRRFLRRIATTTGGAGLLAAIGLPKLAHGQSQEVDFSILEDHPHQPIVRQVVAPPPPPSIATVPSSGTAPSQPAAASPSAPWPPPGAVRVTEDRALWVEPGYLLLIRWNRPADNTDVVAALEGMTEAVQYYLTRHIAAMDDLHDLDRLHTHEHALVELIEPRIEPAFIEKLHLDHDCNAVCSGFGWTGPTGPENPLPGMPMPTSWE